MSNIQKKKKRGEKEGIQIAKDEIKKQNKTIYSKVHDSICIK